MKLATFDSGAGPELGAVIADRIVPLNRAAPGLPSDMIGLIAAWPRIEGEVRAIAAAGEAPWPWAPSACSLPSAVPARSWPLA